LQDLVIALCVTVAWYLAFELIKLSTRYRRYKAREGQYKGYGYVLNDSADIRDARWDELKQDPVSSAVLNYQGGDEFILEVTNPAVGASTHIWEGTLKFVAENMAEIGYRYKKWPSGANLEHSAGYKRVVFVDSGSGRHTIYVYSNDSQRFGREVFIKA
jgi:hypothetical protein